MSIKIDGSQAKTYWLSDNHNNGRLTKDHGILYIPKNPNKLGQITRDSMEGLYPWEAFEQRYTDKSLASSDIIAEDLIIFDKVKGSNFNYDDAIRKDIHNLFEKRLIPFDALYPGYQLPDVNNESLIFYNRVAHLSILLNCIKQYFGLEISYDTKVPVEYRYKQGEDIEEILTRLRTYGTCLYTAYTGRGKTIIALDTGTQICPDGGIALLTTPIAETKVSFEKNINTYHFGKNRNRKVTYMDDKEFVNHSIEDLRNRANTGELIFVVLTVQLLRYQEDGSNSINVLRNKFSALKEVDLWIRDERHLHYEAQVTSEVFSNIKAKYTLDLTATPYNVYSSYNRPEIFSRTLLWGLKNKEFTKLPTIRIDAVSTPFSSVSSTIRELYSMEEGFDPRKLFQRENDNFLFEAELLKIRDKMYHDTLSKNKNPLSITNDTQLSAVAKKCGIWVLPSGQNGDSASEYIPALANLLNTNSKTYFIDSYSIPKNENVGEYIESLVKQYGRVIILTCEKLMTGTDIPCLGHCVLMTKMNSITEFEQGPLGRLVRTYAGKNVVKVYCIAPAMEIKVKLRELAQASAKIYNYNVSEYEMIDCIPFTEYTGSGYIEHSAKTILSDTQEHFKRIIKRNGLPPIRLETVIASIDQSVFKDIGKFKNSILVSKITDDNGSRVKNKISINPATGNLHTKKEKNIITNIVNLFQAVMAEAKWISYSTKNYDYSVVMRDPAMVKMFPEVIDPVISTIEDNIDIKNMVTEYLTDQKIIYSYLQPVEVHDDIFVNNEHKRNIGLVYLNVDMATQMIGKMSKRIYNKKETTILVVNALSGILPLLLREKFPNATIICAEYFDYFKNHLFDLGFKVVDMYIKNGTVYINGVDNMKFDVIVGNPPYQTETNGNSRPIWDKFILKSFELLKEDGYLSMVHPAGWRNVTGKFTNVRDLLLSKQMEYLEIHNESDGQKVFGASTRYDWYNVQNVDKYKNTIVKFEDGSVEQIDLSEMPFIPNHSLEHIKSFIAKEGEERVEIISNSAYHTQRNYINKIKIGEFKYPVVYTVNKNDDLSFRWSSTNQNGHFGVSKIILMPATGTGRYIDAAGEYGLTQFTYGIVDSSDNLPFIKNALESKKFENLMTACSVGLNGYNHKVLSTFRKDFWKEFV